jgi:general stress protein 26
MEPQQSKSNRKADRPDIPRDYGIETSQEGMLPWSWVEERMKASRNYWIGSTRPDGRPHVMPVWGVWVDGELYFGTGSDSRKARNLAANPNVVVHLESGDECVIFEGIVEEVSDRPILVKTAKAYAEKYPGYTPDPEPSPGQVNYRLIPRVAYAWTERDYPKTATRWQFQDS